MCPPSGQGQGPAPPRVFGADLGRFRGTEGRAGESPDAFLRPDSHNHPQCGRFRELGPTLFQSAEYGFDADLEGLALKARNCKVLNDAIVEMEVCDEKV